MKSVRVTTPTGPKLAAIRAEVDHLVLEHARVGAGHPGPDYAGGWISGFANIRLVAWDHNRGVTEFNRLIEFPAIASAIGGLMKRRSADGIFQVMVNRLEPAGELAAHRDGIPLEPAPERWHLPVVSNPLVEYWEIDPETAFHMTPGWWWGPISYWELHGMRNLGSIPRTHLVVDLLL